MGIVCDLVEQTDTYVNCDKIETNFFKTSFQGLKTQKEFNLARSLSQISYQ